MMFRDYDINMQEEHTLAMDRRLNFVHDRKNSDASYSACIEQLSKHICHLEQRIEKLELNVAALQVQVHTLLYPTE